ncbi:MAG: lysine-2,3-aminomutase-like protein [Alphaproteobacteria bacterium]
MVRNLVQSLRERSLRSAGDLSDAGLIAADDTAPIDTIAATLPVAITPHMAGLIDASDLDDPIARQFVPDLAEAIVTPDELRDPIGDNSHAPVKGIVHRYPDRVLLTPILACPVYCRFCFRRETVGDGVLSSGALQAAIAYISDHEEIWEVILSGGDPLILSPRRLAHIVDALDAIGHVAVIRIHTRVPAADPGRVTSELVAALKRPTPVYVTLHCNHARELSPAACAAIARLVDAGLPMLSQTVLLKGVNDEAGTLEALMRALVRNRVKPYYLHHGDLARGTGHFRTTIATGRSLMKQLRGKLSGIAQPTYVLDIPGGHGKAPIGPCYLEPGAENGGWEIEDWRGGRHAYRESITPRTDAAAHGVPEEAGSPSREREPRYRH